jgi:hypothetical protein
MPCAAPPRICATSNVAGWKACHRAIYDPASNSIATMKNGRRPQRSPPLPPGTWTRTEALPPMPTSVPSAPASRFKSRPTWGFSGVRLKKSAYVTN